jgi:fibronectin type 3 domain-containing protein
MKKYAKYFFAVLGLALSLAFSTCSIPFENIGDKQKPDIPVPQTVVAQTIAINRIDLSWQVNPIAASYSVYRSITENGDYTAIATVQGTFYSDISVSANATYFYYITLSANNMGEGGKSLTVRADTKPPEAPESISASVESATKITVTWQPVAAAESYKVYRSITQDSGYVAITGTITTTSYSDVTVSFNDEFFYRVTSINYLGEGEMSIYEKGSVKGPDAPQGLTAVPKSESSIKLEWNAVDGVTGYEVYGSTSSGGTYTKKADITDTSWTDTSLSSNTSYYYKAIAVNGIGPSGLSMAASGRTMGTMEAPTVIAGMGQLAVSWTPVAGASQYEVYCGTSSAPTTLYATVSSTTTTITGLTNNTLYYVRLKAKNATGITAYGATASGTPSITPGFYDNVLDAAHKIGNQNLTDALTYLSTSAQTGHEYFIVLGANESVSGKTLSYSGKTVGITLMGSGAERIIGLNANGALFTIGNGVTLTLDNNVTLLGRSSNSSPLVSVSATLVMNYGAKITGNTSSSYGGGVYVNSGVFTINGGTISGNTSSSYGGGVYVKGGMFTMEGGTISGNTASYYDSYGGGVYVDGGMFTMEGGAISGNTAYSQSSYSFYNPYGGGVYVKNGTFTMKGGIISGNTASSSSSYDSYGGGVSVSNSGTFRKVPGVSGITSGIIYGSEATGTDANSIPLKNTANSGSAVYSTGGTGVRNTTAGQTDYIDTSIGRGLSASGVAPFGP